MALAATVLGAYLLWAVAVAPALHTLRTTPIELDQLDRQWHEMQRLAVETQELRATPPLPPAQAAAALRAATARLGSDARLSLAGDRATVTLTGVDADSLRDWLVEARSGARAQAVQVQLTRTPQGFNGSVVLQLPGAGAGGP